MVFPHTSLSLRCTFLHFRLKKKKGKYKKKVKPGGDESIVKTSQVHLPTKADVSDELEQEIVK